VKSHIENPLDPLAQAKRAESGSSRTTFLRQEARSADGSSHNRAIRFGAFGEAAGPLATDAAQAASRGKNYAALTAVCIGGIPYFLESFPYLSPFQGSNGSWPPDMPG
jgi:hypothetical protein